MLKLIENAKNNADEQGFDGESMEIMHVAAHKVGERQGRKPRAMGRADPWNTTLCDIELVLEEVEE
jgi:large subunit ribosomal protein L22